ncbi:hypothetical protein S420910_091 [Synechococcus phage S-CAM7]|uniref:Uncharacterized protein n=2 Tax=Synechococcus phage S-CAM7 TaxID=1883368 RepID=A0A1D8KUC7_9CAUD|nr:hypothetical protein S420910_091 [Synechococcus phage S-CAM7]
MIHQHKGASFLMNTEYQLADTITETLTTISSRCSQLINEDRLEDVTSMLNEWTLNDDTVVLTHFLNETTDSIEDQLMYVTMSETHITEGSFWFDPEVELPTDNI